MRKKYRTLLKKTAFVVLAAVVSLTWSGSGQTQGTCVVERGQDPLDVLTVGVRHNVWIVLDTSGSMNSPFAGTTDPSKFQVAKQVLEEILDEFVDASGEPLVNWGLAWYWIGNNQGGRVLGQCDDAYGTANWLSNAYNQCRGLDVDNWIKPPACGDNVDQVQVINDQLDALTPTNGTYTPNGISLLQIAQSDPIDSNLLLPNQRNYLLLVTDGDDTCECPDQGLDLAGEEVPLRTSSANPDATPGFSSIVDIRAYNAGLRARRAFLEMNDGDPSSAIGDIFVVGMGLEEASKQRTNHLAWEASNLQRPALFANDPEQLRDALRNALGNIGIPEADLTLSAPIVGSVPELIPEIPGLLINDPVTGPRAAVADDVIADTSDPDTTDSRNARVLRAQLTDNVLFTTSVETPGFKGNLRATNVYSTDDFGTGTETRTFDGRDPADKLLWDAGSLLQARHPDDRTILFNRRGDPPGTEPLELRLEEDGGTIPNADLADLLGVPVGYLSEIDGQGALTRADAARMVVQVIRGYRLSVHPDTRTLYMPGCDPATPSSCVLNFSTLDEDGNNTWKMLDPTNVAPTVVQNPGRSPDVDPPTYNAAEYGNTYPDGFYWDNLNRQTMVYMGTNGGVMHAFRGDNGAELYAYIPADVLGDWETNETPGSRSTLKDLVALLVADRNGIQNHKFFISSPATVQDIFLNSDGAWHTALAFGRGRGGKFVTALDISNIGDWDANPANLDDRVIPGTTRMPKLLFTVGNREGVADGLYDGMGETWSVPIMGNVAAQSPLQEQAVMFFGAGYGCPGSGNNEGQFFYVLKMEDGSVYQRFQTAADEPTAPIPYNGIVATPATYNPHRDAPRGETAESDLTTRAYVGDLQGLVYKLDCSASDRNQWTFDIFYEFEVDQPITAAAALKKVRGTQLIRIFVGTGGDQRVDSPPTLFQLAALRDIDPEGANNPGTLQYNLELNPGERVEVAPIVIGDAVFFAASTRSFDAAACTGRFDSRLFALQTDAEAAQGVFDLNTDTSELDSSVELEGGKVTGLYGSSQAVYVSKSGNIGQAGETLVFAEGEGALSIPDPIQPTGAILVLVRGFRLSPF